jgi:hypothetical protein
MGSDEVEMAGGKWKRWDEAKQEFKGEKETY